MVLRTIAFVLLGLALSMAVFLGWGYQLGMLLYGGSPSAFAPRDFWLQRMVGPEVWRSLFAPLMTLPAWSLPSFLSLVLLIIAAIRPGRD